MNLSAACLRQTLPGHPLTPGGLQQQQQHRCIECLETIPKDLHTAFTKMTQPVWVLGVPATGLLHNLAVFQHL